MKKGTIIFSLLALAVSLVTTWAVSQPKPRRHSNRDARRSHRPQ